MKQLSPVQHGFHEEHTRAFKPDYAASDVKGAPISDQSVKTRVGRSARPRIAPCPARHPLEAGVMMTGNPEWGRRHGHCGLAAGPWPWEVRGGIPRELDRWDGSSGLDVREPEGRLASLRSGTASSCWTPSPLCAPMRTQRGLPGRQRPQRPAPALPDPNHWGSAGPRSRRCWLEASNATVDAE